MNMQIKIANKVSLEDIDLLFGERALGTLPDDLHKEPIAEVGSSPVATDTENANAGAKKEVEGEAV
jgi:hypothetical protein